LPEIQESYFTEFQHINPTKKITIFFTINSREYNGEIKMDMDATIISLFFNRHLVWVNDEYKGRIDGLCSAIISNEDLESSIFDGSEYFQCTFESHCVNLNSFRHHGVFHIIFVVGEEIKLIHITLRGRSSEEFPVFQLTRLLCEGNEFWSHSVHLDPTLSGNEHHPQNVRF
jgi:hypothetical protein